jgi:hypothetical protein
MSDTHATQVTVYTIGGTSYSVTKSPEEAEVLVAKLYPQVVATPGQAARAVPKMVAMDGDRSIAHVNTAHIAMVTVSTDGPTQPTSPEDG